MTPLQLRHFVYLLIGTLGVGVMMAKICGAENLFEPSRYKPPAESSYTGYKNPLAVPKRTWPSTRPAPTPMFSSNDKSRWATVKSLVEQNTYVIGQRENFTSDSAYTDRGIIFDDGYQSLDKVMNPETGLFYSSKPPLFATLLAGEYYILHHACGLSIDQDRWWVVIIMLLTVNVLPFMVYLYLLARLLETYFDSEFGKVFTFLVAACATFVTTFSMTLNNHTPAVYCVLFAITPLLGLSQPSRLAFFIAGFFAALTATFELPALSFTVALGAFALFRFRAATWPYVIGAIIPIVAFLGTNALALGSIMPAYSEFGGPWYDFAGSQWAKLKDPELRKTIGIDGANEPKWLYTFHLTLGHHGWFSLTPVWCLSALGLVRASVRATRLRQLATPRDLLALLTVMISVVVFSFYVYKSNNYGGFCSCARWLMWFTPLWLLGLPETVDRLAKSRWGLSLILICLVGSVFSVHYPAANPWRPPWILQLCETQDWLRY